MTLGRQGAVDQRRRRMGRVHGEDMAHDLVIGVIVQEIVEAAQQAENADAGDEQGFGGAGDHASVPLERYPTRMDRIAL